MIGGLRLYSLITRRPRARVLAVNEQGEVLLVKNIISSSDSWTLPGGGVGWREPPVRAAQRELYEETGIAHDETEFRHLHTFERTELDLGFVAPLYFVKVSRSELPRSLHNPSEIAEVTWYSPAKLPQPTAQLVHAALEVLDRGGALR